MSVPTPAILANIATRKQAERQLTIATIDGNDPGKVVTLGRRNQVVESIHTGVIKTKQLTPGARVRAFIRGEARGGERVVASVTKIDDGAFWHVEFSSAHPAQDYKAAYRWFDESLVGSTVRHTVKVPAFVAKYDEDRA